jgi:hypothetical protein
MSNLRRNPADPRRLLETFRLLMFSSSMWKGVRLKYISAELPRRLDLWHPAAEDEVVSLIEFTCGMLCARLFDRLVVGFHKE